MFNIGVSELIVVGIVALFVFGPGKLPEVARAVGKGVREFRSAMRTVTDAVEEKPNEEQNHHGDKK